MSLVPVTLPPGMFKNGTPYSAKNRWAGGNLVRWHEGSLRPVGGWELIPTTGLPNEVSVTYRDMFVWTDNETNLALVAGSNDGLYSFSLSYTFVDITPAGFVGSSNVPSANTGYGRGPYGRGLYGTPRIPTNADLDSQVYRWQFSSWGEDLIAAANSTEFRGNIYAWTPGDAQAAIIPNAPTDVNGALVTDQRIVMAIGSQTDPRIVRWSDRENREDWTPTQVNLAGFQRLEGRGALTNIHSVLNQTLILSTTDAHVARYIGAPFAYGFDRVGDECGALSSGVVQVADRFAMWIGDRKIWMYDGTVKEVPCDVMDFLYPDINRNEIGRAWSMLVSKFNEIWWFYMSNDSQDDIDSYVAFDYEEGHWSTGKLPRTCGIGGSDLRSPLMLTDAEELYRHEQRNLLAAGSYAETGPLELGLGDVNMAVSQIFPDLQTIGDVTFTLLGKQMPTDTEYSYGPYTAANPTNTRAMGREIRMRVDGVKREWEVGDTTRFEVAGMGTGRR